MPGGRVVVAFPGGSSDWELSFSRVEGFTQTLQDTFGVKMVNSPEEVAEQCDLIMITSVDGRVHRELFERIAGYGTPVFIDKPLTTSWADARAIQECALSSGIRWFSSSVWRYTSNLLQVVDDSNSRNVDGPLEVYLEGPWPLEAGRHGRFWYGIHAVEVLYSVLGTGCCSVKTNRKGDVEIVSGVWSNGRKCIFSCQHEVQRGFSGLIKREDRIFPFETIDTAEDRYAGLLRDLIAFGVGGDAPVSNEETIDGIAFMEAACLSGEMDRPFDLSGVMEGVV
ncbi:MAG: Gfo/Idh/MocA family oxidoreductase [Opitutaceae bacterium]|nr:Gfo/Idh/MocA family oxidoreductase [Opitutaceae bacterium]